MMCGKRGTGRGGEIKCRVKNHACVFMCVCASVYSFLYGTLCSYYLSVVKARGLMRLLCSVSPNSPLTAYHGDAGAET